MTLTPPCDWCPAGAAEPGVFGFRPHPGQGAAVRHACAAHRAEGEAWWRAERGEAPAEPVRPPPGSAEGGQGRLL